MPCGPTWLGCAELLGGRAVMGPCVCVWMDCCWLDACSCIRDNLLGVQTKSGRKRWVLPDGVRYVAVVAMPAALAVSVAAAADAAAVL